MDTPHCCSRSSCFWTGGGVANVDTQATHPRFAQCRQSDPPDFAARPSRGREPHLERVPLLQMQLSAGLEHRPQGSFGAAATKAITGRSAMPGWLVAGGAPEGTSSPHPRMCSPKSSPPADNFHPRMTCHSVWSAGDDRMMLFSVDPPAGRQGCSPRQQTQAMSHRDTIGYYRMSRPVYKPNPLSQYRFRFLIAPLSLTDTYPVGTSHVLSTWERIVRDLPAA
jgi:hypothetical protein